MLSTLGSDFGYFLNDKKRWIIVKPDKKESLKEVLKEISITAKRKIHLGAAIGSREYLGKLVSEKVSDLVNETIQLIEFLRYSQRHFTPLLLTSAVFSS